MSGGDTDILHKFRFLSGHSLLLLDNLQVIIVLFLNILLHKTDDTREVQIKKHLLANHKLKI